ncbi:hypothetical protein M406DRAFT_334412 [Cryphonectria parasitica EP155]|uniref:Uncharacterized protein n=1 Tax=Cryphonectria parasitica (strain ATCC 38755 / EP155) TaxID=660469 RepID=A0A9P4XT33_CRYP1|nr:uncharacterized protein M406DRAFT_334412 [Cryphonectria parasitica EP155]KAF3760794.1 hypothetical protein M406DRAFT_334412 [Cryphonectria parasitica EP155]
MAPPSAPPPSAQKQTPTTRQSGSHQFASTPRFNVSETPGQKTRHQQQLLPLFSTPAPATARPRATQFESDAIDTSPISPGFREDEEEALSQHSLNESIEIDSPSASKSLSGEGAERPPKRRRVSISPDLDSNPAHDGDSLVFSVISDELMALDDGLTEVAHTPSADEHEKSPSQPPTDQEHPMTDSEPASPSEPAARHPPNFRAAPRFRATDAATETTADRPPLPDAFSPQRRGAKYVPGGLAAEVRDWLVQVKGASEYDRPAGASVQMKVDEVRDGSGMWIVGAHEVEKSSARDDGNSAKVILAGDGRISALGRRNFVRTGGMVSMYQPMWDINLSHLGHFAVVCDWEAPD